MEVYPVSFLSSRTQTMRPDIYLVYLLLRLFGLLPMRWLQGFGALLGRLALRRGGRMARYTAVNLRIVKPELPER